MYGHERLRLNIPHGDFFSMNANHPECEALRPRQRQICRGEAGLSPSLSNKYRALWGLPPLSDEDFTIAQIAPGAPIPSSTVTTAAARAWRSERCPLGNWSARDDPPM